MHRADAHTTIEYLVDEDHISHSSSEVKGWQLESLQSLFIWQIADGRYQASCPALYSLH